MLPHSNVTLFWLHNYITPWLCNMATKCEIFIFAKTNMATKQGIFKEF